MSHLFAPEGATLLLLLLLLPLSDLALTSQQEDAARVCLRLELKNVMRGEVKASDTNLMQRRQNKWIHSRKLDSSRRRSADSDRLSEKEN
ncbi:hypothetical protein F2P81_009791 [Scophthalmus maximus]|uniref:Uncharacterized protein n=1 Tax=Scophthalmus maximus TaxID=52904 RepID=A0A6A4STY6_SCOMX|nr:hypothetical protein F2P81_009791 [Scophthalmus maximus]